jgi:hypothetical protein
MVRPCHRIELSRFFLLDCWSLSISLSPFSKLSMVGPSTRCAVHD